MDKKNTYIEMKTFNSIQNIIQKEFLNSKKKNNITNNKLNSNKYKTQKISTTMTGSFNF